MYTHSIRTVTLALSLALGALPLQAQHGDSMHTAAPRVAAVPLDAPVTLDGKLDEEVWSRAAPATGFTQQEPEEGKTATQRTEVRFAFDGAALYVGARMYDSLGAAGVRTRLARRDQQVEGDYLELTFDTFHDHNGQTVFRINPSGVKYDGGQAAAYADPSWDPVWDAAARTDSLGWTAELRIPLSQLRFPLDSTQTWGVQLRRYVERLNEMSMWSFWGKKEAGGPSRFGHLEGVRISRRPRGFEVLPYTVARASYVQPTQPGSPFQDASAYRVRVGGDVKALLTSNLTLSATLNPDFGQVEVDPAVVNLSAFETFFPEKRPFFVEGSGLFGFGDFWCFVCWDANSTSLFYSRRIGRSPQGFVTHGDAQFVQTPENSTILGAAKVTGRTSGGLQIGVLDAVTRSERALVQDTLGGRFTEEVEPATNYFVGRVKQNYRGGNTTVGVIGTSVIRRFDSDALEQRLPAHAEAVGVDWEMWWKNRTYHLLGNFALSNVSGDSLSMWRLQNSSARYFQRPDRVSGGNGLFSDLLDASATSLRGYGGYLRLAKDAGAWQWESAVNYRSPGFEVNDAAFLHRADYVWMLGNVRYNWTKPTRHYRWWQTLLGAQQEYNFDGDRTALQYHALTGGQLANYWYLNLFTYLRPEVSDDALTRGGPVVRRPRELFMSARLSTDSRKAVVLTTSPFHSRNAEGALGYGVNLDVRFKPASNVQLSLGPSYRHSESTAQFVLRRNDPTATHFFGQRVVFADIEQNTFSMNTRLNWTFTPTLTLELFAQPFVFTGDYSRFKEFTGPRTTEKRVYGEDFGTLCFDAAAHRYTADPNGSCASDAGRSAQAFSFRNPDLNVRSLRGNAVLRWEYRPGSTLFFVWQQTRRASELFGDFSLSRDASGIFAARPDNVFLVKATYWFGR
jgi:hypothetical protein